MSSDGHSMPLLSSLPKLVPNGLTSVELFAGGGLQRLGVEWAGVRTIWANDFDKNACRAHEYNFGVGSIVRGDITQIDIDDIPDSDIVVGSPPCQSWSVAGKGEGDDDPRGQLVWRYLEIIQRKQPRAFMFENVKGLITKRHRPTFDALIAKLSDIGYNVSWKLINCWDYGVAQKRERVFVIGIHKSVGVTYEFPQSEYDVTGYHPVLRDAIGDLPEPTSQHNGAYWTPPSEYTYDQANRVQSMDAPSNTIPAHHNSGQPIHPTYAPRRFSVRECMRIMSVPDTYVFPDDMSLSAMYKITGNGVPSRVAYHLMVALSNYLI